MSDSNEISLHALLKTMIEQDASDLHLTAGSPPVLRLHGRLVPVKAAKLSPVDTKRLSYSVLTESQKKRLEENLEIDFSFGVKDLARFRANVYNQRGAIAAAYRLIPWEVRTFKDLGLPPVASAICDKPRGLVLVTGPTGSGKSTTLAAMIDKINSEKPLHILSIEDPIEFLHHHKKALINQREIHSDTHNFSNALRSVLRQDPDVVLIGEMRDLETMEAALTIAETGHLTFATLHTNSTVQTINRIIDAFPAHQQSQVRTQLSFVLEGVLSQTLLPRSSGSGRVLALEIMIPNSAIRNLIREDKNHQIYAMMQAGQSKHGMQTFNQCLASLFLAKKITLQIAMNTSSNPDELQQLISRGTGLLAESKKHAASRVAAR